MFFKLFESKQAMSHTPECTNSLDFFPVQLLKCEWIEENKASNKNNSDDGTNWKSQKGLAKYSGEQ